MPKIDKSGSTTAVDTEGANQQTSDLQFALKFLRAFDSVASIFSTCWLIAGGYYVYNCYTEVNHHLEEENSPYFCDYTAYTFAFIVITIGFVSLALSVIAAICACYCRSSGE